MIIPVRCFTCGNPISKYYDEFQKGLKRRKNRKILNDLNIKRYCCRRMLISHIDIL